MKTSIREQLSKKVRFIVPLIIHVIVCTALLTAALVAFVNNYQVTPIVSSSVSLWDIIHAQSGNLSSLLPFAGAFVSFLMINWINPDYPRLFRFIWEVLFAIQILYYHIAIDMGFHRVPMSLVGLVISLLLIILALVFDNIHKEGLWQDPSIARRALVNALGNEIRNQNILNVQLFECKETHKTRNIISYKLINKAHLVNTRSEDINSILVLNLEIPDKDYQQFGLSLNAFETLIENGALEEDKSNFRSAIEQIKESLRIRLSSKRPEQINQIDSCLARLLVCYTMLEQMVDQPVQAVLDLNDGELGLDIELEKALFSTLRTGMLGAILFKAQRRYYFRYRKDGYKAGRKYCAFLLDSEELKEKSGMEIDNKYVCLVTIRENSTNQISSDILEWIARAEKRIVKEYCNLLKGAG